VPRWAPRSMEIEANLSRGFDATPGLGQGPGRVSYMRPDMHDWTGLRRASRMLGPRLTVAHATRQARLRQAAHITEASEAMVFGVAPGFGAVGEPFPAHRGHISVLFHRIAIARSTAVSASSVSGALS